MTDKFHSVHVDDRGVAYLKITRAKKANVLSTAVIDDLIAAMKQLSRNTSVRVLVLSGDGEKAFVAGADLKEMSSLDQKSAEIFISKLAELCEAFRLFAQPVIAKIQGWCIGAGLELAMACDIRVAASDACFTMPEVKMGIPSVIHAALMPRLIGRGRARRMMLTAEIIDSKKAYEWGLIDEVVSRDRLDEAVDGLIENILECTPEAIRVQKEVLRDWDELPFGESIERSIVHFGKSFTSGEPQAIMRTFFEKQKE